MSYELFQTNFTIVLNIKIVICEMFTIRGLKAKVAMYKQESGGCGCIFY